MSLLYHAALHSLCSTPSLLLLQMSEPSWHDHACSSLISLFVCLFLTYRESKQVYIKICVLGTWWYVNTGKRNWPLSHWPLTRCRGCINVQSPYSSSDKTHHGATWDEVAVCAQPAVKQLRWRRFCSLQEGICHTTVSQYNGNKETKHIILFIPFGAAIYRIKLGETPDKDGDERGTTLCHLGWKKAGKETS